MLYLLMKLTLHTIILFELLQSLLNKKFNVTLGVTLKLLMDTY